MEIQTFLKLLLQDHTSLTKEKLESNLSMMTTRSVKTSEELVDAIFEGHCVVLINGFQHAYILETHGTKKRSLGDSTSETVVRGPKVGFIEDLNTNLALVRQRLKNPDLKTVNMKIGEKKYTQVTIMYIDGIVETSVLKEVKNGSNKSPLMIYKTLVFLRSSLKTMCILLFRKFKTQNGLIKSPLL